MKPEIIESLCIRVPRESGELVRKRLQDLHFLNTGLKIKSDSEHVFIPVLYRIDGFGELSMEIFEILEDEKNIPQVPGAYELIGDIAIIDQHEENHIEIADILLKHKNIKTVFRAAGAVLGEYRTREIQFLKGVKKTETVYRENGCRYLLDVADVYFTPRLSTERMRIAGQIRNGQKIVDMFAGIGPFSILIAKTFPGVQVIAIDKNPAAIRYLRKNISLNKVRNVEIREGDARNEVKGILDADHVIMNLPHSALEFLDSGLEIIKRGGIIHLYAISHEDDLFDGLIKEAGAIAKSSSLDLIPLNRRIVRPYAPYQYNVCIDLQVSELI